MRERETEREREKEREIDGVGEREYAIILYWPISFYFSKEIF